MRRLEQLIDICRKETGNTRYDNSYEGSGISQAVFVQHFRDAQDSLYMHIVAKKTKFFRKTLEVPVVPMQEFYAWPSDMYVRALETLQWRDSRYGASPITLLMSYTKEKLAMRTGYAYSYIPSNEGIEMNPPINYGNLYMTYEKKLPNLQKKAGKITAAAIAGGNLTSLEVDGADKIYDQDEINSDFFLCVVDKFGNVKAKDIQYESCANGVFTMNPFAIPAGQSLAVGDFILVGQNSCNVAELPDICEGYLRKYVIYRVRYGDYSAWTKEAKDDLGAYLTEMDDSFGRLSEDISQIPITNYDYL